VTEALEPAAELLPAGLPVADEDPEPDPDPDPEPEPEPEPELLLEVEFDTPPVGALL
jgi:hypothetical protein